VAATAAAAAAHITLHSSEWSKQFGMLQWMDNDAAATQLQQQQQQQQVPLTDAAADPCWLVTGGVSMQAAAWAGSCNFTRLRLGLLDAINAAAAVQQRCGYEVPQSAEEQHQQQLDQDSTPWLAQLQSTLIPQPINCLLLAQLLLCSVDQFCSNGAADFDKVVKQVPILLGWPSRQLTLQQTTSKQQGKNTTTCLLRGLSLCSRQRCGSCHTQ
jgi:hypothetical protein